MKKLITIILILALLMPAAALAEEPEIDIYSGYGHIELDRDGTPHAAVVYFDEDGTCYYFSWDCVSGVPYTGSALLGVWEYTEDREVATKFPDGTEMIFHISSFHSVVEKETMKVFEPFSALFH